MLCDGVTIEACPECYRRVPPLEKGVRGIFQSYGFLKIPPLLAAGICILFRISIFEFRLDGMYCCATPKVEISPKGRNDKGRVEMKIGGLK